MSAPLTRFENDELRRVVFFAKFEARRLGATEIAPQHVLPGFLHLRSGLARRLLAPITIQELRDAIAPGATVVEAMGNPDLPLASGTERALAFAADVAAHNGQNYIRPEYLLLGLLREEPVTDLLRPWAVTFESVRTAIEAGRRTQPALTIVDSPAPDLSLVRFDAAIHPEFAGMLAGLPPLQGAADHAVVLTNLSAETITAMVARWTVVDPGGTSRVRNVTHDDYNHLRGNRGGAGFPRDSLASGGRLLITIEGFHQALDVSQPHFWISGSGERLEHDAAEIVFALDSVVYTTGRLVGPDEYGIGDHLHGRHAAARHIAQLIKDAEAAGEDVAAMLMAMSSPESRSDRWWGLALMARGNPQWAKGWLEMPAPPQFFRSG